MGIFPSILELLGPNYVKYKRLQSECAWLIANMLAGADSEMLQFFREKNIIGILCDCLTVKNNEELNENVYID